MLTKAETSLVKKDHPDSSCAVSAEKNHICYSRMEGSDMMTMT